MKTFKISYSEYVPTYDMEIKAESMSEAVDEVRYIMLFEKNMDIDIWNIEEKIEAISKDKN